MEQLLTLLFMWLGFSIMLKAIGVKTRPGRTLGRIIVGLVRGAWWLTKILFTASFDLLEAIVRGLPSPKTTASNSAYGTASFLQGRDRRRLLNNGRRHKGLLINGHKKRLTVTASQMHCVVYGNSGSGKTTRYLIPNCLSLDSSMLIFDPSSEIREACSASLERRGINVKVVTVSDPRHSLKFNPLHRVEENHSEQRKICEILLSTAYGDKRGDNSFWNDGAKNFLHVLLRALMHEAPEFRNLPNLKRLCDSFGFDGSPLNSFIAKNADDGMMSEWKAFLAQPEKIMQGMVATARTALEPFSDPNICQLMSKETLHFESLRTERTALFICIPETDIDYFRFFTTLLYVQIMAFSMVKPEPNHQDLFFLLDEFGIAPVPGYPSWITSVRKKRVSVSMLLQSRAQLEKIYHRDAHTILTGAVSSHLFYPGQDMETCLALEKILGRHGVTIEDESGRRRDVARNLMTADEIRTMDKALFLHANQRPVILNTVPYFKNRRFLKLTRMPPPPLPATDDGPVQYIEL